MVNSRRGRHWGLIMHMFFRVLGALPRNMTVPVIVLAAGWYGGAKYGAPDYVLNSIDGMIAQGGDIVSGFLGGQEGEPAAPAEG